jgi:hypothetical protein
MRIESPAGLGGVYVSPEIAVLSASTSANLSKPQRNSGKKFLPRRSGESRFAPPQYFYPAAKSGALPIEADRGTPRST